MIELYKEYQVTKIYIFIFRVQILLVLEISETIILKSMTSDLISEFAKVDLIILLVSLLFYKFSFLFFLL